MQYLLFFKLVLLIIAGNWPVSAWASSGDLDPSFGSEGRVITDFFGRTDVGRNLLIDANGKILISGSATKNSTSDHYALARYNSDGTLDSTFDKDGKVTTNQIGEGKIVSGGIDGVAVLADGKIVACGRGFFGPTSGQVLLRYHSNGSLDQSFGDDGSTIIPDATHTNYPLALTLDSDEKIIVVAAAFYHDSDNNSSFAIFRYNTDGSLDESFGEHGQVRTQITAGANVPRAVKIDARGRIVAGGFSGHNKFVVVRYNQDGSLDTAFGNQGIATINFNEGGNDSLNALAIQEDGKIVVGGDVQVGSFAGLRMVDFGLARLTPDGQLDASFNGSGTQVTYFVQRAASSLWALVVQADGKIIAVGDASIAQGLGIARYNNDGSLDESFGQGGKQVTSFGRTCHWEGVALQQDGNIVAGGYVWNGKHYDIALARYQK